MGNLSGTLLYILVGIIGILVGLLIASLFGRGESKKKTDLPKELKENGFIDEAGLWYSPALKSILTRMDGDYFKDYNALSRDQKKKVYHLQKLWQEWSAAGKEPEAEVQAEPASPEAAAAAVYIPVYQDRAPEPVLEPYEVAETKSPFSETLPEIEQQEVDPLAELQRVALEDSVEEVEPLQVLSEEIPEVEIGEEIPQPEVQSTLEDEILEESIPEAVLETEPIESPEEPAIEVEAEPAKPEALTIAGQISKIMDEMLEGNPLKEKGVKLIENQKNGVDVWVGMEKFDGIGAVPYPEVQELIRNAVKRWEQESALGKK